MELITDALSSQEMEHRLNTLQTSLNAVERSITRFENLIEDCQMQKEEACLKEEIHQEQKEEEVTDVEMVDEEECGDSEPSDPHGEADTKGPLLWPLLKMLSPLRRTPSSCSWHSNPKIQLLDLTVPEARPVRSRERWPSCA